MTDRNLTKIRRLSIIQTLLDGEEHHTQELLKNIRELEFDYYFSNYFKPEKVEPVNNPKLSSILDNLVEENIIDTRTLSKRKDGRSGNIYWLYKDIETLYKVLKELNNPQLLSSIEEREIDNIKCWALISGYGKELINMDLVKEIIPEILYSSLKKNDKDFILATLKISSQSLYKLLQAYNKGKYWSNYPNRGSYLSEYEKTFWKEKFFMDLSFWIYHDFQFAYHEGAVSFDVDVNIKLNNENFHQHNKRESADPSVISSFYDILEDLTTARKEIEKNWENMGDKALYDEYMLKNKALQDSKDKEIEYREKEVNLKQKIYDDLWKLSEKKIKNKQKEKQKLIERYYDELKNLEEKYD